MANMDITQRTMLDRTDLRAGGEGIRRGSEKGATIYNGIALVVATLLSAATLATIDSWAQWVVLAVIVATTMGFMGALSPTRRHI